MPANPFPVVIVHGGAGHVPVDRRPLHAAGCRRAADAGLAAMLDAGDPVAAVLKAVSTLEDDPQFNAGTGACLGEDGELEFDASIMVGHDLSFGGVACLSPFRNPIDVADAVRRDGRHTLYAGPGAVRFARENGFVPVTDGSMVTESARARLERVRAGDPEVGWAGNTVGAVARGRDGRIAAATSTGGTVGKVPGRVGDSPLPGAGTYADDDSAGCSTTGIGEEIMRFVLARHACDLVRSGLPAQVAADAAVAAFGARIGGRGGLVLVGRGGDVGFARNTETMSYAIAREGSDTREGY